MNIKIRKALRHCFRRIIAIAERMPILAAFLVWLIMAASWVLLHWLVLSDFLSNMGVATLTDVVRGILAISAAIFVYLWLTA